MRIGEHFAQLGWTFTATHLILQVAVHGKVYRVALPVSVVHTATANQLQAVGCRMAPCVGAVTCGGFFSSLKRAVKRASRAVKKAVPKAIRKAASKVYRKAAKAVRSLSRLRGVVRTFIRSPVLKGALLAASVIPGAAVITAPSLAALQVADTIDRRIAAGEEAARRIAKGARDAATLRAKAEGARAIADLKNLSEHARRGSKGATAVVQEVRKRLGA